MPRLGENELSRISDSGCRTESGVARAAEPPVIPIQPAPAPLPSVPIGRHRGFDRSELERWLARQRA